MIITEVCPDGLAVGVVALAVDGVGGAVAVGEEAGAEPGDDGEGQQHDGADHPPQLRDRPRQRQHAGPDHRRDDVRARRHQRPCRAEPNHGWFSSSGMPLSDDGARAQIDACTGSRWNGR